MRLYRPAGERRVRIGRVMSAGVGGEGGSYVVEVDAGVTGEDWQRIASASQLFDAERIRVAIVQTIAAEVGARLGKRRGN